MIRFTPSIALFISAYGLQPWVGADPVIHVLVQFSLLAAAGYLIPLNQRLSAPQTGPALVLALVFIAIWMLPRTVDAALGDPMWHAAKYITIPLGIGLPLRLVWRRIGPVLRGFLKAQAVSMLLFLGFLYTHAPVRICNSYLIDDQITLGFGYVYVATGLAMLWIVPAFVGQPLTFTPERPKA